MISFNEFKRSLNLRYTFGIRRDDGASRRYHDSNYNIGCETHTDYNHETEKWGMCETLYYFENERKEYDSLEKLYEAYREKVNT